jgi:hypothetical protein
MARRMAKKPAPRVIRNPQNVMPSPIHLSHEDIVHLPRAPLP